MRRPTLADLASVACLAVSLVAMGAASARWWLVAPFLVALVPAALLRGFVTWRPALTTYAAGAIPFALAARFYEIDGTSGLGFGPPFYVALYMQAVALLTLAGPETSRRTARLVFIAASAMAACGADVIPRSRNVALVAAFAPCALVALRASVPRAPSARPRGSLRLLLLGLASASIVAVAAGLSHGLVRNYDDVTRVLVHGLKKLPLEPSRGFSGEAKLGSIPGRSSGEEGRAVMIRAFGPRAPGYLRGRSFATYEKGAWSPAPLWAQLRPTELDEGKLGRVRLPGRPMPAGGHPRDVTIRPDGELRAHYFLPLAAAVVDTTSDHVWQYQGGALESRYVPTSDGYDVHLDAAPVGSQALDVNYLALPEDPEVLAAVDGVIAKLRQRFPGTSGKVAALRDFIAARFEYRYGISFDPAPDPIVQFLTAKQHGHCELFATAGALALRRMGVPARYVTGFICEEKLVEGTWVARVRHAHAWVEAADETGRWQTVELTPPAGMPTFEPSTGTSNLLERLRAWWEELRADLARRGFGGFLADALRSLGLWVGGAWWRVGLLGGIVLVPLARRLLARRRGSRVTAAAAARSLPADLALARERLVALERSLAKRDLARAESETLDEWAGRLAAAALADEAAFVRDYAARRYEPFA